MISLVQLLQVKEDFPQEREEVAHDHRLGNAAEGVHEDLVQLVDCLAELEAVVFRLVDGLAEEDVDLLEVVDGLTRQRARELEERRRSVLRLADPCMQPVHNRLQRVLCLDHHGDGLRRMRGYGRLGRLDLIVD